MIGSYRKIYVARFPIDLRFGINRLLAYANTSGIQPQEGDLAVFSGRNRKRLKVLHGDSTGIWLSVKLFSSDEARAKVRFLDDETMTSVSPSDLATLLEGRVEVCCLMNAE